jgi:hypothetical protein
MLVLEHWEFYNMDLNSIPRVCGSCETTVLIALTMSRLESGYTIRKFKPYRRTASSESVKICFERLRIHFLESEVVSEETLFC